MAEITAKLVAELRAKTDAPMMECKKALVEAAGDLDKAEELLRVKLGNKAGKAAARITAEALRCGQHDTLSRRDERWWQSPRAWSGRCAPRPMRP